MFYQKEGYYKKAATIKRFKYLPLSSEFKKRIGIAKDQEKILKIK